MANHLPADSEGTDNPVSNLEVLHALANLTNDTGELVANDEIRVVASRFKAAVVVEITVRVPSDDCHKVVDMLQKHA